MNDSLRGSWKGEITSRGSLAGGLPRDIVAQQPSAQNGHDGDAMDLSWGHSVSGAEKRSKLRPARRRSGKRESKLDVIRLPGR